jgi:capsular polysaccharide biosynthesis protein
MSLFMGARSIVGTHGAGLANIAWISDGAAKVVELARVSQPQCFERLSEKRHASYVRVDAADNGQWLVDMTALESALEWASAE